MSPARSLASLAIASFALLLPAVASALLKAGSAPADFGVADPDDNGYKISALRAGRPALIVYEDKDGGGQNERFLQRLGKLRDKDPVYKKTQVLAIADVASWDFWPAKGFVKSALRDAGKKNGITVYADWTGAGRANLAASKNVSNLVLLDAQGKVVWASAGKLSGEQEDTLIDYIGRLGK
jgi:hypothetical protein